MTDPEQILTRSIYQLLRRESFYAHILAHVTRVVTTDVPTMAVSFREDVFYLYVNPEFLIDKLTNDQRIAVLKHEVLHLVFKHLFRGNGKQRFLENIAADLVVNQYVEPWPLPEGAILLNSFPDLKLKPWESMEYYYNEIRKLQEPNASNLYPVSCEMLERLQEDQGNIGSHELWGKSEQGPASRVLGRIMSEARTKATGYGSLPAEIRRSVEMMLQPAKISWKQVLKVFNASCGRTVLRTTRRKESRRFEGNPGRRIKRLRKVVVAIDTSGSIDEKLLSEFWNEILGIYKSGTALTILECDARIQNEYELRKPMHVPSFKGGGGTSFDPVVKWVNKTPGYNGLIYFTDGYGPSPARCRVPVLWCIYGGMKDTSHLKGKVIHVGEQEQDELPF